MGGRNGGVRASVAQASSQAQRTARLGIGQLVGICRKAGETCIAAGGVAEVRSRVIQNLMCAATGCR